VRKFEKTLLAGAVFTSAVVLGGGVAGAADSKDHTLKVTPVVTGLNNPRGVALDSRGDLYVAEAGPFPVGGEGVQKGVTTGHVTKFAKPGSKGQKQTWSTPFDALYTNERGIPEVVGPSGLSYLGHDCEKDEHHGDACGVYVIVGESARGFEKDNPDTAAPPAIGHLFRLSPGNGSATDVSDVGDQQYQWADDNKGLWEEFPDANPYGVLAIRRHHGDGSRVFAVDAGANTVSEVAPDGSNHVIAFVPNDGVRDSTPTCAAWGPDGALYVGTLNLVKNNFGSNPGQSDVWRIDPDTNEDFIGAAHLWATGLTTVTSCTFDHDGNFWATEMFQPNGDAPPGDVVRIPFRHPDRLQRIGGGQLPFPGGIAPGHEDEMYVSINSLTFVPDTGAVVKLKLH
jgi:hypothetical protein